MTEESETNKQPITSFGILTDIQYADVDDGMSYDQTRHRYYRNSLKLLNEAVDYWRAYQKRTQTELQFVIQLGDIIDGKSKAIADSKGALERVLDSLTRVFEDSKRENKKKLLMHIWGNHEMYNFLRNELVNTPLNTAKYFDGPCKTANYYAHDITSKLRLICLDYYEFSAIGHSEDSDTYKQAIQLLRQHNSNEDLNSFHGLRGRSLCFTKFNGTISSDQQKWLANELARCHETGRKAIVCGHLPLHAQAGEPMCLAWNAHELLELIWSFEDTCIAYFAGHDHLGGYFRDKKNIQHITFPAVLETPKDSNAFATCKVYDNKILVEGVGIVDYYEIFF